jgi:hypothetical protein
VARLDKAKLLRELQALRENAKPRALRREDLKTECERRAFDFWRFSQVQRDMGMVEPDEKYDTYEDVLAWSIEWDGSPELRAERRVQYGPTPTLWSLQKAEERLGYKPTLYEYYLEQEIAEQHLHTYPDEQE